MNSIRRMIPLALLLTVGPCAVHGQSIVVSGGHRSIVVSGRELARSQATVSVPKSAPKPQKGSDPESPSSVAVDLSQHAEPQAAGEVLHSIRLQQWGASWCPSCPGGKAQAQKAADQLGVQLEYFDYDRNKELARSLGITSVPRTFVVIDGKIRHRYVGQTPAATIVRKARDLASDGLQLRPAVTTSIDSGPLRMRWNFEGRWNPSIKQMINHLAEHGIDATGMTRQQMANAHDAAHGSGRVTQYANKPQPVRLISRGGGCPNGRCPR